MKQGKNFFYLVTSFIDIVDISTYKTNYSGGEKTQEVIIKDIPSSDV